MRKIHSRKAAMELETFIAIALLVVFAIGFILVQAGVWAKFMNAIGNAPDNFTTAAAFCAPAAGVPELLAGYCGYATFRDVTISGEKQLVNCYYLSSKAGYDNKRTICNDNLVGQNAKDTCLNTANNKLVDKSKINGFTCKYWKTWTPTTVTPTTVPKCTDQVGNTQADVICDSNQKLVCPAGQSQTGTFSDITSANLVCCKAACVAAA